MTQQIRQSPIDRKREILGHALIVARIAGYQHINRKEIADAAGCTTTLVSHYFGTILNMRRAIMGEAIRVGDLDVIAQGMLARDPRALRVNGEIKTAVMNRMAAL